MNIYLFETSCKSSSGFSSVINRRNSSFLDYQYGIRLVRKKEMNEMNLIILNARNEHDRAKFCDDLKEAILETNEMEGLRIQSEVEKLRNSSNSLVDITNNNSSIVSSLIDYSTNKRDRPLSRTLSNSLLDMTFNHQSLPCRTSQCSLDSGMVNTNEREREMFVFVESYPLHNQKVSIRHDFMVAFRLCIGWINHSSSFTHWIYDVDDCFVFFFFSRRSH